MTDHPDIVERLMALAVIAADIRAGDTAEFYVTHRSVSEHNYKEALAVLRETLAAEITRLRAEAEALRKDAERYRWLRDPSNGKALQIMREYGLEDAKDLDDAIDAAIAATKEQQA